MERILDPTRFVSRAGGPRSRREATRRRRARALSAAILPLLVVAVASRAEREAPPDERNALPIRAEVSGTIDAPFEDVRRVLLDLEHFGAWFPRTAAWRVLARPADGSVRVYGRQALPWPVGDRDYVADYRWWEEGGVFVLRAVAVPGAPPPPPPGVVRVDRMQTEWRVHAAGEGTAVRYRYEGDPGGRLPRWVARAGWRSSTGVLVERLRAEVARREADASAPASTPSAPPPSAGSGDALPSSTR